MKRKYFPYRVGIGFVGLVRNCPSSEMRRTNATKAEERQQEPGEQVFLALWLMTIFTHKQNMAKCAYKAAGPRRQATEDLGHSTRSNEHFNNWHTLYT